MCETTQLIVESNGHTDYHTGITNGHVSPSNHFFDSIRGSIRSISDTVTESMNKIGFLGSLAIATNSLTGPAMLCFPATFQRSGLIPTTVVIIFVCLLSALCCLHMSNTISKIPNNHNFGSDVGYSECFRRFFGAKSYTVTQFLFFSCVTCLNVSSIVDTAQVVDTFFGHWVPAGSVALNIEWTDKHPVARWVQWDYNSCSESMLVQGDCVPFSEESGILFTMGYGITLLVFLPMALFDLKENAFLQVISFVILLATSIGFVILFLLEGIDVDNISLWGTEWGSLFGVVLFNFALVIAIPAWLYEKESYVTVPVVVYSSSLMSSFLYISIGILGAIAVPNASQNMLESLMDGTFGVAMQLCASIFAFFIVGFGCPLFCILARMNLMDGNSRLSRGTANWLAIYMPFFSSWIFYGGDDIYQLLSWGGIIFTSLIVFVLPLVLSLHALDVSTDEGSVDVYKPIDFMSKNTQKVATRAVLSLAIASIIVAGLGNLPVGS